MSEEPKTVFFIAYNECGCSLVDTFFFARKDADKYIEDKPECYIEEVEEGKEW